MLEESFKARLKWARESKQIGNSTMSQSDLARLLKVSPQSVSQWETGVFQPRSKRVKEIADMLGVRYRWLAYGESPARTDGKTEGDDELATECAFDTTSSDWIGTLREQLPGEYHSRFAQTLDLGPHPVFVDYVSDRNLVMIATVRTTVIDLQSAIERKMWRLTIAAALVRQGNPRVRPVLMIANQTGKPIGFDQLMRIQWEAGLFGIAVTVADSAAAAVAQFRSLEAK